MAKPRVFISSTFFDLRQVRADLERFIKEMGYESVRNETGSIPYGKELKLEDYCYKEISGIDILVGIIGGRFGSTSSKSDYSITQTEIKTALEQNKSVYIFIDKNVHSEYETYLINKEHKDVQYRYADDIRIYQFLEEIYKLPKNNVIHAFETAQDIINFLREQWSGLLKDLLSEKQKKVEFDNISQKVNELNEVAETLKTYLENVLENVNQTNSSEIISKEQKRLKEFQVKQRLLNIDYIEHLNDTHDISLDAVIENLKGINDFTKFRKALEKLEPDNYGLECMIDYHVLEELNKARAVLDLDDFKVTKKEKNKLDAELDKFLEDLPEFDINSESEEENEE